MKIAVVNDIHVGKCLEYQGKIRAASHLVEEMLERYLGEIIRQHSPDVLINLGDLIRSEGKESDAKTYRRVLSYFKQINLPVIHLLGNHELKKMSLEDVENAWNDHGFSQKSYGHENIAGIDLLWLGLQVDSKEPSIRFLPSHQLQWLQCKLKEVHYPTLIFTHCAIDDHNVEGNFFYEASEKQSRPTLFLRNQDEIRRVISSSRNVIAVLQAHLHYFHTKKIDDISYITCPAMVDNICAPNVRDNLPEIYTIISLEKDRFVVKIYSGKYCFAGYERAKEE